MKKIEMTIIDPLGFHARPVSAAVNEAKKYEAAVTIIDGSRKIPLESVVDVLSYQLAPNSEVILVADGPDEAAAISGVLNVLKIAEFIKY